MTYQIGQIPTHQATPTSTFKAELEDPAGPTSVWSTIAEILAANQFLGMGMPLNMSLTASVSSNILTIAVKDAAGNDPSSTSPVLLGFRSSTLSSAAVVQRQITAALSIDTNATGASLGTTSGSVPFRIYVVAFDDGGTIKLALWQSVTGGAALTSIANLNEWDLASTTAMSASATAAGTFYSKNGITAVTSKAFRILGYFDWGTGLSTAGTYASGPTTGVLFAPGMPLPGRPTGKTVQFDTTSATTTSSGTFVNSVLTASISLSSSPNAVRVFYTGTAYNGANNNVIRVSLARGSTAIGPDASNWTDLSRIECNITATYIDRPGVTTSTTYNTRILSSNGTNNVIWPVLDAGNHGVITLEEIMV